MHVYPPAIDLVYDQSSGCLYMADSEDARTLLCRGYSGHGPGLNDPAKEAVKAVGPIPCGMWRVETARHHIRLGPLSFPLKPVGHKAHGRSGFYIHGDNAKGNGTASTGCIVAPRPAREAIRALGVRSLLVIDGRL